MITPTSHVSKKFLAGDAVAHEKRYILPLAGRIFGSYPHQPDICVMISMSEKFIETYRNHIQFDEGELAAFIISHLKSMFEYAIDTRGETRIKSLIERVYQGETDNLASCRHCSCPNIAAAPCNSMGSNKQNPIKAVGPDGHHHKA